VQRCVVDLPKTDGDIVFDQDTLLGKWRRIGKQEDELFYIVGTG